MDDQYLEEIKTYYQEGMNIISEGETPPSEEKETPPKPKEAEEEKKPEEENTEEGEKDVEGEEAVGGGEAEDFSSFDKSDEDQLNISELGRIYTLKKLYYKLLSLQTIMEENNDPSLDNITEMVQESVRLFTLVMDNIKLYKDKIDDIIYKYYRFVEKITKLLNVYFKKKKSQKKEKDAEKESLTNDNIDDKEIENSDNTPVDDNDIDINSNKGYI